MRKLLIVLLTAFVAYAVPAFGQQTEAGFVIESTGATETIQGAGRDFIINGASNNLTILGKAGTVTVNGSENVIHIEEPDAIIVPGYGNSITYSRGNPAIDEIGADATVQQRD